MKRAILHIIAIAGAALFLIPLLWTVSTSLKTREQIFAVPPQWIPMSVSAPAADGTLKPVVIVERIKSPALQIRLLDGSHKDQVMAVQRSAMKEDAGRWQVQLAAGLMPAEIVRDFPDGVAKVRFVDSDETQFLPPSQLVSRFDPQWRNFAAAWNALPLPFHWFLLNSYTITLLNVVGQTLSCSLVAYGFARFRFRGRGPLFMLLLSTMMLPSQVTMIPQFLIWSKLRALDTFIPLTVPSFFATSAFAVFLLRQFFMGLPKELDEAAMIDGCGPLRIWWQIIMPLSRPAVITVSVLAFLATWDDFINPLIYLNRMHNYTVSLALRLYQDQYGADFSLIMAAALVHIVPVLILFFVAQRYFVKGIATTGIKG